MAVGTLAPAIKFTGFDNNGDPLSSGLLYTFAAGTTTPLATYSDVALTIANANPIVLNSAGRPASGGSEVSIFLAAASYKFTLKTSAGVEIWSVDNVGAIPATNIDNDVTGTAGEALVATKVAYLNATTWMKADADAAASSTLPPIGFVVTDIALAAQGAFRLSGRMTGFSGLAPGSDYFVSATAGEITATPPANARYVGRADSISSLIIGANPRPSVTPQAPCGRLTLTTAVPVTTADVTAATTLYFAPYHGNTIMLYDGTRWIERTFAQLSLAVPATTATAYDVFAYDNAGVLTLELTAWSSLTARATALVTQDGLLVKTGALTRLYLGSFRTTAVSGQTEDSLAKRYLWNYYHRVPRGLQRIDTTATWAYSTATVRQANGAAANQVEVMVGVAEVPIDLALISMVQSDTAGVQLSVGIGEDSTTTYAAGAYMGQAVLSTAQLFSTRLMKYPAIGSHAYSWNEWSSGAGTTTWFGQTTVGATVNSGLRGWIEG